MSRGCLFLAVHEDLTWRQGNQLVQASSRFVHAALLSVHLVCRAFLWYRHPASVLESDKYTS